MNARVRGIPRRNAVSARLEVGFAAAALLLALGASVPADAQVFANDPTVIDASPPPPGLTDSAPLDENDRKAIARAKAWFARLQAGDIDRAQLTPEFASVLTDAAALAMSGQLKPLGEPKTFASGGKFLRNGTSTYVFRVGWDQGAVLYQFAVDDASGKIAGLFTRPAPPAAFTR